MSYMSRILFKPEDRILRRDDVQASTVTLCVDQVNG